MFCELVYYIYLLELYKYFEKNMNKYISAPEFFYHFYVFDVAIMFITHSDREHCQNLIASLA